MTAEQLDAAPALDELERRLREEALTLEAWERYMMMPTIKMLREAAAALASLREQVQLRDASLARCTASMTDATRVIQLQKAEVDRYHEALRSHVIGYTHGNNPPHAAIDGWCTECEGKWRNGESERHAPGCLAAPTGDAK